LLPSPDLTQIPSIPGLLLWILELGLSSED
jgi:hypothetical protein